MPLHPKQQRYLDRYFPGLISAIEKLGPGEFDARPPAFKTRGNGIRYIELNVCYHLADGWIVELLTSSALRAGGTPYDPATELPVKLEEWERTYYRLDYRNLQNSAFRVDFTPSSKWGRHVHMLPDLKHTLAADADPDTTDLDPRVFVEWVARYRHDEDGTYYPLTKKKR
jgi:hypothetical protein